MKGESTVCRFASHRARLYLKVDQPVQLIFGQRLSAVTTTSIKAPPPRPNGSLDHTA
jgi:hypothetical protein